MTRARQLHSAFLANNTDFIALNVDNQQDTLEFYRLLDSPPYPFLSDVNRVAIDAYQTTDPKLTYGKLISWAATIAINQNHEIIYQYIGSHRDRPDLEEALTAIIKANK